VYFVEGTCSVEPRPIRNVHIAEGLGVMHAGLYLPDAPGVPRELRGIGFRLEDDIVVTAGAPRVLSSAAPLQPDDVERLVGSQPLRS
jgi:Xaa-Pro aminopeptidase